MTVAMYQRDKSLDAIKGVGILSITLLHFESGIFPNWLNIWIAYLWSIHSTLLLDG